MRMESSKTPVKSKEIKAMSVAGRQPIVSTSSQGSIAPALIITAVAVLFYYDGLQVYIHGEIWTCLYGLDDARGNFYFGITIDDIPMIRPFEYATEDLIRFVFGLDNPLPFHAIVLGLHIANSILVFLILKKVLDSWAGLFGALLFTSFFAHPLVVTYHFGLGEAIRAFFLLSCFILFYRYRENPTRTNYVLTLGAFILAMGSKESTLVILPPLMYLVDRYIQMESRDRGEYKLDKNFYVAYIPFIIICVAWWLLITYMSRDPRKGTDSVWLYLQTLNFDWKLGWYFFYLSAVTSFGLCSFKGPGDGTSFLVFSLALSILPVLNIRTKRRIVLLWAGWLVTIIPLIIAGMNFRYLYLTSAFSMAILAICVYRLIVYVTGKLRLKEAYVTLLAILVFSVPVTTNFLYVRRHVEYFKTSGRISESLFKPILADFPQGTLGTKLVFINLPDFYEPPLGSGHIVARNILWNEPFAMFSAVYGKPNVGPIYQYRVPELYYGRHPLFVPGRIKGKQRLFPEELEKLTMEKDTRVYIFNPGNDTFLNVTGKDYNSIKKLIGKNCGG